MTQLPMQSQMPMTAGSRQSIMNALLTGGNPAAMLGGGGMINGRPGPGSDPLGSIGMPPIPPEMPMGINPYLMGMARGEAGPNPASELLTDPAGTLTGLPQQSPQLTPVMRQQLMQLLRGA